MKIEKKAILKAKELACEIILLDDGFSKYDIKKFDILIRPNKEPTNLFCLPSGGYREPKIAYTYANLVLKEAEDFKRVVSFSKAGEYIDILPSKLLLLTAISKPKRLLDFLPQNIKMEAFEDHHTFTQSDINRIKNFYKGYSIITTEKDYVKLEKFDLKDIYLMHLELQFQNENKLKIIENYISSYK